MAEATDTDTQQTDPNAEPQATPEGNAATEGAQQTPPTGFILDEGTEVPDKFKDAEGKVNVGSLLKSYREAEKKLSGPKTNSDGSEGDTTTDGLSIQPTDDSDELGDDATIEKVVESAGLDYSELRDAYLKDGSLNEEQYEALKKKGYPKGVVDQFISAHTQQQMAMATEVYEHAYQTLLGDSAKNMSAEEAKSEGQKRLETLRQSAPQFLSDQEQQWYNEQVNSSNPTSAKAAVDWLVNRHRQAVGAGKANPLIGGESGGGPAQAFTSRREMIQARQDPRYRTDKSYRDEVDARLAATDLNQLPRG